MYSISIYSSLITFPLSFARHTWVVLESPLGGVNRYEIHNFKNKQSNTFLYINNQKPDEGMNIFMIPGIYKSKLCFKATCHAIYQGEDLKHVVELLEKNILEYPYRNTYSLFPGPNSNTFTKWIIKKALPDKQVKLPWNAFGKAI